MICDWMEVMCSFDRGFGLSPKIQNRRNLSAFRLFLHLICPDVFVFRLKICGELGRSKALSRGQSKTSRPDKTTNRVKWKRGWKEPKQFLMIEIAIVFHPPLEHFGDDGAK